MMAFDPTPLSAFLSALRSAKPERELVARLDELTGGESGLLAPWGEVLAGTVREGGLRREVRDEGRLLGTLVLFGPRRNAELLDVAAEVYALAALRQQARAARAAAAGETLLAELLTGARAPDLTERLALHALEGEPYGVAVAELPQRRARSRSARQGLAADLDRLRVAVDTALTTRGHRVLSAVRGTRAVWWWTTTDPAAHLPVLLTALTAATDEDVRLGLSERHDVPTSGSAAFTQALLAVAATGAPRSAAAFSTLDPLHWVLSSQPREHLALWRETLLRPLRQADEDGRLLETLRGYLGDPDHRAALAERLNVHPNTLRHRLNRIEELLGQSLSNPATLARLYLALGPEG